MRSFSARSGPMIRANSCKEQDNGLLICKEICFFKIILIVRHLGLFSSLFGTFYSYEANDLLQRLEEQQGS